MKAERDIKMQTDSELKDDMNNREKSDSFSMGSSKNGMYKFYFSLDEPLEMLIPVKADEVEKAKSLTKLQKGLKVLAWLRENGFCRGE